MAADLASFHSVLRRAALLLGLAAAVLMALGIWAADGRLIYALDDAYIHLAMGEEIARFNYGVNGGEIAASSSSPLYPLLLAPLAGTPLQAWLPLAWNLAGLALSVALLAALFTVAFEDLRGLALAATVLTALAFNLPGQLLLGMEHGLQIAATLAVLVGLVRLGRDGEVPAVAVWALVLGPLLRYENLVLSAAALCAIAWLGRPRLAGVLAIAVAAAMLAYTVFLVAVSGQALPNPILIKAGILGFDPWQHLVNWLVLVRQREAMFAGLLAAALAAIAWRSQEKSQRAIALVALAVVAAQILFGGFDVLGRRAAYATIFGWCALLWLARQQILDWAERLGAAAASLVMTLALAAATPNTALALLSLPQAQRNVYEQQFQLHRLIVDFIKAPVAVNDLGLASWRNDRYVLDLLGIGNSQALRARAQGNERAWLVSAIEAKAVEAALIYEPWFAPLPAGWVKLGEITLSGQNVNLGGATVAIFATRPQSTPRLRAVLQAWFATLPAGIRYRPL